jgi:peptide/nickel transport system ATP-binding protein
MTAAAGQPLLEVSDVVQRYTLPRESLFRPPGEVLALNGVSAQVMAGRSLGVVGESGSGKSTFARIVMALERPTSGQVSLLGRNLNRLASNELRHARRDFQMVFQDPYGSLDPRQTIARIVAEPLTALERIDRAAQRDRVATVLRQVGLRDADMDKYPHEFSGGSASRSRAP